MFCEDKKKLKIFQRSLNSMFNIQQKSNSLCVLYVQWQSGVVRSIFYSMWASAPGICAPVILFSRPLCSVTCLLFIFIYLKSRTIFKSVNRHCYTIYYDFLTISLRFPNDFFTISLRFLYDFFTNALRRCTYEKCYKCLTKNCVFEQMCMPNQVFLFFSMEKTDFFLPRGGMTHLPPPIYAAVCHIALMDLKSRVVWVSRSKFESASHGSKSEGELTGSVFVSVSVFGSIIKIMV